MAMRIAPVPYFWAEVKFSMIGDLDVPLEVSLKVKYRRLEQEEYEALLKQVQAARIAALTSASGAARDLIGAASEPGPAPEAPAAEGAPAATKHVTDREIIDRVVLDWDDVLDDNDQKLPFTKDNLERALTALGCKASIVKRFFDLHTKELEKNFAPRPATTSGT
jgi:hypothetical protein